MDWVTSFGGTDDRQVRARLSRRDGSHLVTVDGVGNSAALAIAAAVKQRRLDFASSKDEEQATIAVIRGKSIKIKIDASGIHTGDFY